MLKRLGEYIDMIVNSKLTPHSRTHDAVAFYRPARDAQEGFPLTFQAAKCLLDRVHEGDYVFILHNAGIDPYLPHGETDGPLGAVSLARAVNWGLGARPVFIAEPGFRDPIVRCSAAAGLRVLSRQDVEKYKVYHGVQVIDFPLGPEGAKERAEALLDSYRPAAILAVERLGPNRLDLFHSGVGYPLPATSQAHVHLLIEQAADREIVTVGFGDGGNEVGYGIIAEAVNNWKAQVLGGSTCQCGCGGGTATRVRTTVLVSAATSNWGSYGVSGLIAYATKELDALQDEEMEYRMLEATVEAGAVDASTGSLVMKVDGTSVKANQAIVTLLREIVSNALQEPRPRLFPRDAKEILRAL